MILFFIASAVLVAIVLLLLLPVFYRNAATAEPDRTEINVDIAKAQARELKLRLERGEIGKDDYADEKSRLEANLARDIEKEERSSGDRSSSDGKGRWLLFPLAAVIPVAAGALYLILGTPAAFDPDSYVAPPAANTAQQPPDMQTIIARIQQQLEEQPDDARGWFMLGRAHLTVGEHPQAVEALRKSLALDNANIDVKIRLADAIALSQGNRLVGEPTGLLEQVLAVQPDHPQGLWLYGMALNQSGEPAEAITFWQRLLAQLGGDPQASSEVERLIADANAQLPVSERVSIDSQVTETAPLTGAGLTVAVDVEAGLADDLPADTAVFIYAKAASGPPMPLAVVKRSLSELPLTVELTDAQAMMETMKLSAFDEVIVGARISKTGDPIAQPGDFFSESGAVKTADQTDAMSLTISGVVP